MKHFWKSPKYRPLRAFFCIALSLLLLVGLYISWGCPTLTIQQEYRRAEKVHLVGPGKIVDTKLEWYYDRTVVAETEDGICIFNKNNNEEVVNGKPVYRFTYLEKTGDLTMVSPTESHFNTMMGEREWLPVYLFHEYPEAVSAELVVHISGTYPGVTSMTTLQKFDLALNETLTGNATVSKNGFFLFEIRAENLYQSAALIALSHIIGGANYTIKEEVTIEATISLFDANDQLIAEKTMPIE